MHHRLGRGHFSEVRLALCRRTWKRVAVKVMHKRDAARAERIRSEVAILRVCAHLRQPNLMQVLDVFETEGEVLLICELLANGSLLDLLQREGAQSESAARSIIRQIASGLKAVHEAGIVHRDLKPENILFDAEGFVKLVDFGFAKSRILGARAHICMPNLRGCAATHRMAFASQLLITRTWFDRLSRPTPWWF